jgi:hypothetical protein
MNLDNIDDVTKKHDQVKEGHNFCTTGTPENVSAMKHYLN